MRLDASGRLGIGITSPIDTLQVNGGITVGSDTNADNRSRFYESFGLVIDAGVTNARPILFRTQGAERARIDSSGNLLVGTTSGTARGFFAQDANASSIQTAQTNASFSGNALNLRVNRNTSNGSYNFIGCAREGVADVFFVRDSGNVVNANNSYGAISDIKLKENVTDATPKLEKLNQVRVVNYNLIGDEQKQLGVIAQELEQIFPGMIDESPDRDKEGNDLGTTTKSVKYSVFVPMLIKAIQEQQAIINQLKADVAALKGA